MFYIHTQPCAFAVHLPIHALPISSRFLEPDNRVAYTRYVLPPISACGLFVWLRFSCDRHRGFRQAETDGDSGVRPGSDGVINHWGRRRMGQFEPALLCRAGGLAGSSCTEKGTTGMSRRLGHIMRNPFSAAVQSVRHRDFKQLRVHVD